MAENITDSFISDLFEISSYEYSADIKNKAKRCLMDYLGATFAGSRMADAKGTALIHYLGSTDDSVSVIGMERKTDIQTAILVNGIFSHVAELDDGDRYGMMHPGAPVISALLPLAEREKLSGAKLIAGIIVGYEAALRLASALQPALKDEGFHATGVCGTIGAAIGVAAALSFSKQQMKDTLSAAVTSASGMLKVIEGDSGLKPLNAGNAALSGYLAASIARSGFKGPDDVLSGKHGFLTVFAKECKLSTLIKPTETHFRIEDIYFKPYAACRHCHPAIDGAIKIRSKNDFSLEDIKEILVKTYFWAVGGHDHTHIMGISSAKMSTPFSVAVALAKGKAGIEEYSQDFIDDQKIKSLTQLVKVCSIEELTELVPQKRAAIVEVSTFDGKVFSERVDIPKGEPENPLDEIEIVDKFLALAQFGGKSSSEAREIVSCVNNLEHYMEKLFPLL